MLRAVIIFASLLALPISADAFAAAGEDGMVRDHLAAPASLTVEHAEMLLPSAGTDPATVYVTIWNGTQTQANLVEIASADFGSVEVYRNLFGRVERLQSTLVIPGHAELRMRDTGVHLVMRAPKKPVGNVGDLTITLKFEDGTVLSAPLRIVDDPRNLTNHRHGELDT